MKDTLRHYLNPLHILCRLRQCGISAPTARKVCLAYERVYTKVL